MCTASPRKSRRSRLSLMWPFVIHLHSPLQYANELSNGVIDLTREPTQTAKNRNVNQMFRVIGFLPACHHSFDCDGGTRRLQVHSAANWWSTPPIHLPVNYELPVRAPPFHPTLGAFQSWSFDSFKLDHDRFLIPVGWNLHTILILHNSIVIISFINFRKILIKF